MRARGNVVLRGIYAAAILAVLAFGAAHALPGQTGVCIPDGTVLGSCDVIDCQYECEELRNGVFWECEASTNCCLCAYR